MKLSAEEIEKIRAANKQEMKEQIKESKSWHHFISKMKAKGALVNNSNGYTKIKI